MRTTRYLRAPLKTTALANLQVTELAPRGSYAPADAPPQGLDLRFDATGALPEIALVWEGRLRFDPAPHARLPASPDEMREDRFAGWRLEGALLLEIAAADVVRALARAAPLLAAPPQLVRYENVSLTSAFLFQTAPHTAPVKWRADNVDYEFAPPIHTPADTATLRRLLFDFVHGRAALDALHDAADPAQDFAALPMPRVAPPASGTRARLIVSMSATPLDALDPLWFEFDPFRDIVGWNRYVPPLVDPALKTRGDIDPRHPAHSPIPPTIVFGAAPDDAWVPAHVEHPIRAACRAPSLAGPFRRLDVQRDLGPGVVATDEWRRPYPFHQTIVTTPATTRIVAQLPLDGHLYLRLADGNQTVTTAPRWVLPTAGNDGSGVLALTTRTEGAKVTPPAMASVALNVTGGQGKYAIIASSIEQDGAVVWQRLLDKRVGEASLAALRNGAKKKYNLLKVGTAHLPAHRADYAVLYGLIVESAARHGLTPAFVQAVFFREGVVLLFYPQPGGAPPAPAYRPDGVLSGFGFLGLDTVGDALNHDPAFTPPHPDIGLQQLLDEGYVHPTIVSAANLTNVRRVPPQPNEPPRPNFTADIVGWRAAIELIAAELHARLDQMLATGGHAASDLREDGRRFLSYIRYNAVLGDPTVTTDWQRIATSPPGPFIAASGDPTSWDVIKNGVVAWPASSTDPNFTGRERLRFVALTMTSVATYLDASGAFR